MTPTRRIPIGYAEARAMAANERAKAMKQFWRFLVAAVRARLSRGEPGLPAGLGVTGR